MAPIALSDAEGLRAPRNDNGRRLLAMTLGDRNGVGGGFESRPYVFAKIGPGAWAYGQAYVLFSPSLVMSMVLPSRSSTLKIFG